MSCDPSPFRRVTVDHLIRGTSRISWELRPGFNDAGSYSYQLQVSLAGTENADDWEDVGDPVEDAFVAYDPDQRLFGKALLTHYRIVLTTSAGTYYSDPVGVHGDLYEADWLRAREIIRKEQLRARLVGREGYLLKRRWFGERCTDCLDELTAEVGDSECDTCLGTGIVGGYFDPLRFDLYELGPESDTHHREHQMRGTVRDTVLPARCPGYPKLAKEDVWIDRRSDQRWFVHELRTAAEVRGVPIIVTASLSLAAYSHLIYGIEVDE